MPKPKPNYNFTEYLTLIGEADCVEDLALIEEMLQQDKEARSINPLNYIDIKCGNYILIQPIGYFFKWLHWLKFSIPR